MRRVVLFRSVAALAILGLAAGALAQTFQGSIRGLITDTDGGVLPGVSVTLEDEGTGVTRTAVSNAVGEYVFANVQPGTYTVSAELSGFAPFSSEGLIVGISAALVVDATLGVGGIEETVTVTGETPLIEAASASVAAAVDRAQLEVLPTPGRNVFIMSVTTPNVVHTGDPFWVKQSDQTNSSLLSLGGGPLRGNNYTVDGVSTTDLRNRTVIIPVFEAVEEMKVQTNTYDAEMGRTGGGVFNVIHRRGTNNWGGSGLYQYRTPKVNTWLRKLYYHEQQDYNAGRLTTDDISNRPYGLYGGSFGGPILEDRTFFWLAAEGYADNQASNVTVVLPSAAEAAGDFSQSGATIYNPYDLDANGNRRPFPGNRIPADMIDPVGSSLAQLLTSLGRGGDNSASGIQIIDALQATGNLSHSFSDNWQTSLTYLYYTSEEPAFGHYKDLLNADTHPPYGIGAASLGRDVHAVAFNNTIIPTDTSVLTLRYGQTYFNDSVANPPFGIEDFRGLGFQGSFVDSLYAQEGYDGQFPTIQVAEYGSGNTHGSWSNNDVQWTSREVAGTYSQFVGNHTLRYGGQWRRMGLHSVSFENGLQLQFARKFTQGPNPTDPADGSGNAMAELLLGIPNEGQATIADPADVYIDYFGGFVQDDWRPTPNLVLNLGFRVEHETGLKEEENGFTVGWDRTNPFPVQVSLSDKLAAMSPPGFPLTGGVMYAGVDGNATHQWDPPTVKLGPRVGFAYTVNPETVVRGGYAVFWAPYAIPSGTGADHLGTHGFTAITNFAETLDGVTPPTGTASNPFPEGVANPSGNANGRLHAIGGSIYFNEQFRASPYIQKWSFDLQRDIGTDLVLKLGYVGSRGSSLPIGGTANSYVNVNQLADSYLSLGEELNKPYPNPFYGDSRFGTLAGAETLPLGQLLRPFPHFRNVRARHVSSGKSLYNSMRFEFERRFRGNWGARINYTFTRHDDNIYESNTRLSSERFDIFNTPDECATGKCPVLNDDYGPSRIHTPHQVNLNASFRTPGDNPFASGWTFSVVTIMRTGFPLTVRQNTNALSSYGFGHQRPQSVDVSASGNPAGSHLTWLSGNVATTSGFAIGAGPQTTDSARSPRYFNWDVSLEKTTTLYEDLNLTLRFEVINALNQPNWNGPQTVYGADNWGQITGTGGFPRTVQFMAKVTF